MPHISRIKLSEKTRRAIRETLFHILMREVMSPGKKEKLLQELLTDTEIIMFAKRIALVQMIADGLSYYRVSRRLGMSTSTIKRFHHGIVEGAYDTLLASHAKKKERERFWGIVEKISRLGLPPHGRGRWNFLQNMKRKG